MPYGGTYYEKTQLLKPIHPCTGLGYEFLPSKNIASAWNQRHPCRSWKDSVFVDFFSEDRTAKANFLALYNALHGTDYQSTAILKNIRLKQVLYMTHWTRYIRVPCSVASFCRSKNIVTAQNQRHPCRSWNAFWKEMMQIQGARQKSTAGVF